MKLLTITENDGVTRTRISVPVDAIAEEMADFFEIAIDLHVSLIDIDEPLELTDTEEKMRADFIVKEWQHFGKTLVAV